MNRDDTIELWKHQQEALSKAKNTQNFALFFEQGTGKTLTTIQILREKYGFYGQLKPTLVICPPIVIENWRRELFRFSKIPENRIIPLVGSGKKRREAFLTAYDRFKGAFIAITNYESLLMKELFQDLLTWSPPFLVIDESHRIKDHKAKRTKACWHLADLAQHVYLLTGTPVLNSPLDLFSQFRALDRGETFGHNFFAFRATFFEDRNCYMPRDRYFPNWQIRKGADEKISELIGRKSMRVLKKDCLDLPPLVKKAIYVELSKEQRDTYKAMRQNLIAFLGERTCTAAIALTRALRLQQIVSGFITMEGRELGDERESYEFAENPRADALEELLSEFCPYHKVIVWAVWKQNYKTIRDICAKLKVKYVELHGDITAANKQKAVDSFNSDKEVRVCIGHPGSGGIGVNLTQSDVAIWYSRSFSLEHELQAEARNYRGGSEIHSKVTRYDLVTPDTIDELVMEALANKQEIGDNVLGRI